MGLFLAEETSKHAAPYRPPSSMFASSRGRSDRDGFRGAAVLAGLATGVALVDEVGQGHRVEDTGDRVAEFEPDGAGLAAFDQGTGLLGLVLGHALHGGDRSFHDAVDLADLDLVRWSRQLIAALRAALALDQTGFAEGDDELFEVGVRHGRLFGDRRDRHRSDPVVMGEGDHGANAVFTSCRDFHSASRRPPKPEPDSADLILLPRTYRVKAHYDHSAAHYRPGARKRSLTAPANSPNRRRSGDWALR